jgi:hypothetical protein
MNTLFLRLNQISYHSRLSHLKQIKRFFRKRWKFCLTIFLALIVAISFQVSADAACSGWLCGLKDKLNATEGWKEGKLLWEMLFVGAQALIGFLFAVVGVIGVIKARADEAYKEYFLFLLLFFLALLASNYGIGYLTGSTGTATGGTGATGATGAMLETFILKG